MHIAKVVVAICISPSQFILARPASSVNDGCHVTMQDATQKSHNRLLDYIDEFAKDPNMERRCHNYGPAFSDWGVNLCPDSFLAIVRAARGGLDKQEGGKSGIKPFGTDAYIVKEAKASEVPEIKKLLSTMNRSFVEKDNHHSDSSIAPICRLLAVSEPDAEPVFFTVSLKITIANEDMFPWKGKFDLKGNCFYSNRMAPKGFSTLKDGNFHELFPSGLFIEDDDARHRFRKALIADTEMLQQSLNTDYSLLIFVVQVCEYPVKQCARQVTASLKGNMHIGPEDDPFKLGTFTKTCIQLDREHSGRPIYSNGKGEFFYFWKRQWYIGRDFHQASVHAYQETMPDMFCPSGSIAWASESTGDKITLKLKIDAGSLKDNTDDMTEQSIRRNNKHRPLLWAKSKGNSYVISYGMIDLFMNEYTRGVGNVVAGVVATGTTRCRQNDVDPLTAKRYRARFLLMIGHRLPHHCLAGVDTSYAFEYFPNIEPKNCSLSPHDESCRTMCEFLNFKGPKDDPCKEFKDGLEASKYMWDAPGFEGSTLRHTVELMETRVVQRQVHQHIKALKEKIDSIPFEKKRKYVARLDELETRMSPWLIRFKIPDLRTKIASLEGVQEFNVSGENMADLKAAHDNVPIVGKPGIEVDSVQYASSGDVKKALKSISIIADRQLADETYERLAEILTSSSHAEKTFFEIDLPDNLDLVVNHSIGLVTARHEDRVGGKTYSVFAARFTSLDLKHADGDVMPKFEENELRNYLSYELYSSIAEEQLSLSSKEQEQNRRRKKPKKQRRNGKGQGDAEHEIATSEGDFEEVENAEHGFATSEGDFEEVENAEHEIATSEGDFEEVENAEHEIASEANDEFAYAAGVKEDL